MTRVKLAPIADRVCKQLTDNRSEPGWEEVLWDRIDWAGSCELDAKQMDIVFDMVVARWNKVVHAEQATVAAYVAEGLGEV